LVEGCQIEKIKRIKTGLCVLASLLLPVLVLIAASPLAQAQSSAVLKWAEVDKPGLNGYVVVNPSEVSDIAVGRGDIIYAIDSANPIVSGRVYRSTNAGLTWTEITQGLISAGAVLPATKIACAPDRPQYVAAVTDFDTKVYVSDDNGNSWKDANVPGLTGTIQCIAVSTTFTSGSDVVCDIAIGTAVWGDLLTTTTGQVWVLRMGGTASSWQNTNITVDPLHIGAEVSAIAFSPNYTDDGTILAVASTAADVAAPYLNQTWLCAGQRDLSAQTTLWNGNSLYFTGYPVSIDLAGDAVGVTGIVSSIALPSDYRGNNAAARKVLVSYDRQPVIANSDVYRIDDTASTQVLRLNADGGAPIHIRNVAYFETLGDITRGKLIAGDVNPQPGVLATQVRRVNDPFTITGTASWSLATQPPTGPGNAKVAWSYDGSVAFCGTSQAGVHNNDESAFSRSQDNGNTWEQTSLINTTVNICDIAPAPDSKSFFLASYSGFGPESVWRTAGVPLGSFWARVFTMYASSDRIIMRLSPDYDEDYTIYVAEANSTTNSSLMAVSHVRGNPSTWQKLYGPGHIIDMAVADRDTLYVALPGGYVRKAINSGTSWLSKPALCFPDSASEINMLTVIGEGNILAGSRDSRVAYSTDNGTSFTEIHIPITNHTGDAQVVADTNYDKNKLIYAADNVTDDGIWRWTIGTSTEWEQISDNATSIGRICGLGMGDEGTLYALRSDNVTGTGGGGMDRSLNPSHPFVWNIEWDILNRTLPVLPNEPLAKPTTFDPMIIFPNTMPSLKLAKDIDQNVAWAVDFSNMLIYRFDDNICKVGPVINGPEQIGCDPVSGRSQELNLDWEQLSLSNRYELQIAKDDRFSIRVVAADNITPADLTAPAVYFPAGGMVTTPASQIANWGNFECGHAYYWRTRTRRATTGEIIRSPWSETGSFTAKAGLPVRTDYYGLKLLSPDNGCIGCPVSSASFSWAPYKETTKYRFTLAKDAALRQVMIDDEADTSAYQYKGPLDYGTDYFWRVMALEPAPSDWSATFVFQTQVAPVSPLPASVLGTPIWVWVLIAVDSVLALVVLLLILRTR
jgi:hypothetical protein